MLKLSAIGKFPFLTVSTDKLDFDELLVGKTLTKEIYLRNTSAVPFDFKIEKLKDDDQDSSFKLDHIKGAIPPNQCFLVKVKFNPTIVSMSSNTTYIVKVTGGNE